MTKLSAPWRLPVLSRRAFTASAAGLVACSSGEEPPAPPIDPSFLTEAERLALAAIADFILPPEGGRPGGAALGAVVYIEGLLTAFEHDPPRIFAGGPFSGRRPTRSGSIPQSDFAAFLPLGRAARAGWRLRVYGSAILPGGGPNDALLGPTAGLRTVVRDALAKVAALAPAPTDTLDAAALETLWSALDIDLRIALAELVCAAAFAAPEYGGNRGLEGWILAHFEGDSQPLGYSFYDEGTGKHGELSDAPVSSADPRPDPAPMDEATRELLRSITEGLGGRVNEPT